MIIILVFVAISIGLMAWEISRNVHMDDDGNYTDKDGHIL